MKSPSRALQPTA